MKLLSNRAGVLITHPTQYQYFKPTSLYDVEIIIDKEISDLLSNANLLLGKLDGMAINLPDKDIFVSMYVQKEAVISSQIEGTQATLDDVLQSQCSNGLVRKDIEDVVNYTHALNEGVNLLNTLPICTRYFKSIHKILLQGTRGQDKQPGEIRNSQNWIGPKDCNLSQASYIPPCVEEMHKNLKDLETFINNEGSKNQPLIDIALIHYQFETIHPFLDGNGRVGRILIPLWLINKKVINVPILYLSLYFKEHRTEYYSLLMKTRLEGKYEQWVKFFLKAIIETATDSIETIEKILKLKTSINNQIKDRGFRNINKINEALNFIYRQPYFTSKELRIALNISKPTVMSIIKTLLDLDIIIKKDNKERNSTYCFSKYVNILKPGTEI